MDPKVKRYLEIFVSEFLYDMLTVRVKGLVQTAENNFIDLNCFFNMFDQRREKLAQLEQLNQNIKGKVRCQDAPLEK